LDEGFEARLKRLAKNIEALAEKDERILRHARDVALMRKAAATELWSICSELVNSVNRLLPRAQVVLDPAKFTDETFREDAINLIQINVRGRILQVEYEATPELISTENFRIPYTIEGSIRAFNQELLDKEQIEEQLIFYTVERQRTIWRFFDGRTYRSGLLGQEYLVSLMEQVI
jgi:hypothetical protein